MSACCLTFSLIQDMTNSFTMCQEYYSIYSTFTLYVQHLYIHISIQPTVQNQKMPPVKQAELCLKMKLYVKYYNEDPSSAETICDFYLINTVNIFSYAIKCRE